MPRVLRILCAFFFNGTAPTEIYTLSLHDALPISPATARAAHPHVRRPARRRAPDRPAPPAWRRRDRKSTRLNSSHTVISYAVFCLKKKNILSLAGIFQEASRRVITKYSTLST